LILFFIKFQSDFSTAETIFRYNYKSVSFSLNNVTHFFQEWNNIYNHYIEGRKNSMSDNPLAFVIEDDKNLALAFAEAVEEAEYKVEIIHDGKTAMERLTSTTPALVVLDIHIPHIKGSEILNFIRSTERLENIRVVVASADDHRAAELRGIADLVLLKPIGFRQLQQLASRLHPN